MLVQEERSVNKKRKCGLSAAQKASLWHRWKDGESLSDIDRSLGKHAASIHGPAPSRPLAPDMRVTDAVTSQS